MSMSNGRTTTRFPKTRRSPQSTTPSGRLAAAVDAARPSRRFAALEALEGRTLFAAPTLTSVVTLGAGAGLAGVNNATEDTAYTISYAQLKAASDAADADGDTIKFRIEGVSTGTLKKGTAVVAAGTLIGAGDTLTWTPAANANGTLNAFTIKASDGTNLSTSAVQVKVETDAVNDAPTATSVNTLTGAIEDTDFVIDYATLAGAVQGASDPEGDPIVFQFAGASSGTLKKNGIAVAVGNPDYGVLRPGESWVWRPSANASGTLNAFTIKVSDGSLASSSALQVKVTVGAVNDVPTLSTVSTLTGATEDTAFNITYASLAAASNIADVDGGTAPMFKVMAVSGGTLTKNGTAVTAGTTTLGTGETLVWTPAANANGVLPAFTVVAADAISASSTPVQVNVNVVAADDAPALTAIDTFANGTEDTPYEISYEALVGNSDLSDIDSTTIWFKVAAVSTGSLTYSDGNNSGLAVVPGTTLIKPGYSLLWQPAANANGNALNAFTVKANDGQVDSSTAIQVKVDVAAVADAPTLTSVTTLSGAGLTEDTAYSITFANFATAANEADADTGDTLSFRIESVSSGTLTKNGTAVTPGSTVFATGDTLVWTPDANANGTLNAFTVRAVDSTGLYSGAPVQVKATVTAVNDVPTLSSLAALGGATEDTPFTITYAQLLAASDATDADGTNVQFRIDAVSGGTLKKGTAAVIAGTTTIGVGETLTWTPAADANGVLNAFTVKAYDGTAASASAVQVKVGVAAVNDAPTLTAIANLTGATEDQSFNIAYSDIVAAAGSAVGDVDSATVNYQVTALGNGSLMRNGLPVAVGAVIVSGDTLVWTPTANANGTAANALTPFSVKATDGALLSSTAIPVKVNVANVNDVPTLSTVNTLTGATEDTSFTITYATLAAASNATDVEGPVLFRVESVTTGTLTKGGVAVTPGTTTLGTGETLVWTPGHDANGTLNAFTVKAYDNTAASASAVQVKVTAAAVNDAPTLTTISALAGGTEDTPYTITYAALAGQSNLIDPDGTSPNFLITAVTSGTLTKNGIAVVANTTQLAPGESLVWTPAANANGNATNAFQVKVTDGPLNSTAAVQVKVNLAAVNDTPTLTTFTNLTGANEDATFNITYAQLKAASNVADVENDAITFRIESVASGTLTKGGTAVTAGTTTVAAGDTLVWTPAANAYGTGVAGLPVMTVSAYDGNSYSAAPITVKADVANVDDAPTLTTLATFTTTDAATEDTPYTLTYAALAAAGDQADIDNSTILFRVEAVSSGTLKKGGVAVTTGTTTLGPGETLVWTPAANANGTGVTAFTVKAFDGTLASTTAIPVKFDVTAVNDAPTLTAPAPLAGTEDTALTIAFSDLTANTVDVDTGTPQYKIMAVSSGTLTLNGTAVVPGTDVFTSGDALVWTPDADANGVLNAFTVVAGDGTDWSATTVQVKATVTAVNDAAPVDSGSVTAIAGGTEDTPITISYNDLLAATGMADADPEQTIQFRIDSVVSGTLKKNGTAVTAGASGTLIGVGESLVWTPAANDNGNGKHAFTVKGYDGVADSTAATAIDVDLAAVNDTPTLSTVTTLTGATEDTAFNIAFTDLATNVNDADGDTITYRIESVINGTLTKGGTAVTPGTTMFATGDTLVWTPSADANGTIGAFTIVASDGSLFSATPITVNVTAAGTSDDPTLTTVNTLTKGIENTTLTITYADLLANSDLKDADGGTVYFRIESVDTGTLKKGGVAVTTGTTTLGPGESLAWTPAANASGNGIHAFTVKGYDGSNASTTAVQVDVNVAHVAQMPTLTTITTLTTNTATDTPTEDTAFDIDYAYFAAATDAADPEGGAISFRIESVASGGTLTKGGVAVVPGVTLFSTGDTLQWTPAANASGSGLTAFTVRASTAAGVSAPAVAVKVDVTAANDAPTLTAITPVNGGGEDYPMPITYEALKALSDLRDVDTGDTLVFRIEAVSTGTLTKGGTAVTAGTTTIGAGESVIWTPALDANGLLSAFTVKAYDGTAASASAVQVKVNVAPTNDVPTLTSFDTLTGATAGAAYSVTYANLIAAAHQNDPEGATINYVVGKVLSGTLTKNGVAVIPGVTRVKAGDTLVWTSVAGASGDTGAFTLFATDGQDLSAAAVDVVINVA